MDIAVIDFNLSFETAALVIGAIGFATVKVLEAKGWTPTNRILREENMALIERNTTLDRELAREHDLNRDLTGKVAVLEEKVRDLEARDQAAVLEKLDLMERARRDDHREALVVFTRIADALEGGDS